MRLASRTGGAGPGDLVKASAASAEPKVNRTPAKPGRLGGWVSLAGGLLLAGLMAYILAWGGHTTRRVTADDAAGVAVFFPDREDWDDFRDGARAVAARGLAKIVADGDDALILETPRAKRRVRFVWHGVGGLIETREEVRHLAESGGPPLAVVGSANTVLTAALADALRASAAATGRRGPVLLIPWATSIAVDSPGGGAGTVPLLGTYPGRTFRFCANNRRLADLVVNCVSAREPRNRPGRILVVVDRDDRFSKDLADGFTRAIAKTAPRAELQTFDLRGGASGDTSVNRPEEVFGLAERRLAERLWRAVLEVPGHQTAWVVLPLQEEPTLRMIKALRGQVWYGLGLGGEAGPLRVLCGDGLRRETLRDLAATHDLPFPVWAVSNASTADPAASAVAGLGTRQIPAEIVSALVRCLDASGDRTATPDGLRDAMAALDLKAGDPAALGRPLAFAPSGERRDGELGRVLEIEPGRPDVSGFEPRPEGRWVEFEPTRPGPVAAQP